MRKLNLTRRDFLRMAALGAAGTIVAACGGGAATPPTAGPAAATAVPAAAAPTAAAGAATAAPAADAPTAPAAEAPTAAAADAPTAVAPTAEPQPISIGTIKEVPRNQTAILGWSITSPIGVVNPWAVPGYTHQEGNAMMWEPLSYFGIFSDKEIPWLAESMKYSKPDFTELKIVLNKAAKWSDGSPVTSKDVVFTFEGQMKNDKLGYHAQFVQFVDSVKADDDLNVTVTFKIPAPRFAFEVLTLKFDTGIPIVPATLGTQADVNAYAGGLELIHSGPYDLVSWDKNQKIFDLREDWWAVAGGVATLPEVKRVIIANIGGQVGQGMDIVAQRVVNNEFDATLDMRSAVIGNILNQNPKVTSHTGNESPFGYLDWWPNSLWVNTQLEPYNDPNVRRAMSLTIDRDTIDTVIYEGAKIATIYPFPLYPGLQKFADSPEVKALEAKYEPRKFDLEASAALMTAAGFTKNGDDLWEKDGATISMVIQGFEGIHGDIVPVLVEMLKTGGFDANVNFGTDASQNMAAGAPGAYMFGHGASLKDPYAALELFHSRFSQPIGTTAGNGRFSRYKNPDFDAAVDAMAPLGSEDPKFFENAVKAMEIYWKDQIDIPIIQWLHRIPYNQTYWTNWPTAANVAGGTNGAFWAHTGLLVITQLKAAT
jgi:peptide/nickel transport system substrate-binding protein